MNYAIETTTRKQENKTTDTSIDIDMSISKENESSQYKRENRVKQAKTLMKTIDERQGERWQPRR